MKKIDFTVLIPVYNTKAAELIEAAFSVHPTNQSIKQDYKILIIDDGSTNQDTLKALNFLGLQHLVLVVAVVVLELLVDVVVTVVVVVWLLLVYKK